MRFRRSHRTHRRRGAVVHGRELFPVPQSAGGLRLLLESGPEAMEERARTALDRGEPLRAERLTTPIRPGKLIAIRRPGCR